MKILVVGNLYPPVIYGGYEILCAQVVGALQERGHTVRVVTSVQGGETVPEEPGVERVLSLTTPFPMSGEKVGFVDFRRPTQQRVAVENKARVLQSIAEFQPDIVFCWCMNRLSLGPVYAAQAAGVPVCYTINDEHPKQFSAAVGYSPARLLRALLDRFLYPMATFRGLRPFPLTVISEALRRILLEQGVPVAKARVIHQGVVLERLPFRPTPREPQEVFRVVYAGQISRAKGVHTLVRAIGILEGETPGVFSLDIAGGGVPDYLDELRRLVGELGLDGRVVFLGQQSHDGIAGVYHGHHAKVFCSEWEEPFGLAHMEAMACGCALVSTTTGGTRELVRDGENALAYPAGDAAALARQLRRFFDDEPLRMELVRRGRAWIECHHALPRYVDDLEDFISFAKEGHSHG